MKLVNLGGGGEESSNSRQPCSPLSPLNNFIFGQKMTSPKTMPLRLHATPAIETTQHVPPLPYHVLPLSGSHPYPSFYLTQPSDQLDSPTH
ncbi:hypothetical protein ACOSQ4_027291 [Xanthoceras sorbifolium]